MRIKTITTARYSRERRPIAKNLVRGGVDMYLLTKNGRISGAVVSYDRWLQSIRRQELKEAFAEFRTLLREYQAGQDIMDAAVQKGALDDS